MDQSMVKELAMDGNANVLTLGVRGDGNDRTVIDIYGVAGLKLAGEWMSSILRTVKS